MFIILFGVCSQSDLFKPRGKGKISASFEVAKIRVGALRRVFTIVGFMIWIAVPA
jgi:hypothetical protein